MNKCFRSNLKIRIWNLVSNIEDSHRSFQPQKSIKIRNEFLISYYGRLTEVLSTICSYAFNTVKAKVCYAVTVVL